MPDTERTNLLPFLNALRVPHIDNLRTCLIVIWIYNLASATYGGFGGIVHAEPDYSSTTISTFNAVNWAVVPSLFFVVSGRCTALALETRSSTQFVKYKLLRLAIPAVLHYLFLQVLFGFIVSNIPFHHVRPTRDPGFNAAVTGPSRYLVTLLAFDLVYVAFRSVGVTQRIPSLNSPIAFYGTAIPLLIIVTVSRTYVLGPQNAFEPLALFSQRFGAYFLVYMTGLVLPTVQPYIYPPRPSILWAVAAYLVSALTFAGAAHLWGGPWVIVAGKTPQTATFYALWQILSMIIVGITTLSCFSGGTTPFLQAKWGQTWRYAYPAILLHTVPVILFQVVVKWSFSGLIKALLAGSLGVPCSWAMAWVLLQIPGVAQIL